MRLLFSIKENFSITPTLLLYRGSGAFWNVGSGAHLPLSHTHTPTQTMVFLKPFTSFVGTSKHLCNLRSVKCFRNRFVQLFRWFCFMVLVIGSSWVVWGQKMCSDLKSPMLQVLSNTSLKVLFSTTPNFCLGGLRTSPCPLPPQLRRLRFSPSSSSS